MRYQKEEYARQEHRQEPVEARIAKALDYATATVNEIDLEDVMISEQAMQTIGRMSGAILRNYCPHPAQIDGVMDEILESYTERMFWVEETGKLVIYVQVMGDEHFIQLPKSHWMLKHKPDHCH